VFAVSPASDAAPKRFAMATPATAFKPVVATSHAQGPFDLTYYLKGALAGGICCAVTHGALCPVDVVKTRIQLEPTIYNRGMIAGFRQVVSAEGVGALATGLGPTVAGYFVQGWFKFGGVEFFKTKIAAAVGEQAAWDNRTGIYLASAAGAETIADVFLCPLEATRIRLVQNPQFGSGLLDAAPRIMREDGFIRGFYSGLGPILFKQVPYTMAKFAVQGWAAEKIAAAAGLELASIEGGTKMAVSLSSGVVAGVAAAIISHPADTLLSLVNKPGYGGTGSITSRLVNIAKDVGFKKLCLTGLGARCVMIGVLTAFQFGIFDLILDLTGAQKFHFTNPADADKEGH